MHVVMKSSRAKGKFWDLLVFSRIVEWGKAFRIVMAYVLQNELEANGEIPYKARRIKIKLRPP